MPEGIGRIDSMWRSIAASVAYGSLTRIIVAFTGCAGLKSLLTSTAVARVVYMKCSYFGLAKKVIQPGEASSIFAKLEIGALASPSTVPPTSDANSCAVISIGHEIFPQISQFFHNLAL